jgi:hypothetical protein
MNYFDSQAGFTFSGVKLQLTEITKKQNQFSISRIDEVYFNEEIDFINDKETKITSLLQAAFDELLIKKVLSSNVVSFSVPQDLFITARLPFEPSLLHSDLIEDIKFQLSVMHPYLNFNNHIIRYYEVEPEFADEKSIVLVFSMDRKIVKMIYNLCLKNNLKLRFIDHCHLTANNILAATNADNSKMTLSFYVSAKVVSSIITASRNLMLYEEFPISSTQEIKDCFKVILNKIAESKLHFEKAYLFGDTISNSVAEYLSEYTKVQFILLNPFNNFQISSELLLNKNYSQSNHFFSSSVGAAVRL